MQVYYDRARALAGSDPVLLALARALTPGVELPRPPSPAPIKLFDNLGMLSAGWVSAMAVLIEEGIVLCSVHSVRAPFTVRSSTRGGTGVPIMAAWTASHPHATPLATGWSATSGHRGRR
ncbi:hypothetical protein ABTZ21_13190 [Streptomyces sp. NPDC096191]|uniref:hypothetical protein n=1 Tax=Streptomyces sp. NPDC096191 TaxID=3155426 RepID=UPI00331B809E